MFCEPRNKYKRQFYKRHISRLNNTQNTSHTRIDNRPELMKIAAKDCCQNRIHINIMTLTKCLLNLV